MFVDIPVVFASAKSKRDDISRNRSGSKAMISLAAVNAPRLFAFINATRTSV